MQEEQNQTEPSWQFNPDGVPGGAAALPASGQQAPPAAEPVNEVIDHDEPTVTWTASEYMAHDKSMGWYLILGAGAAVISIIVYLFSKDFISASVPALAALTLGIFAARKPQVLNYAIDDHGVRIGGKQYTYEHFKSFTILQEGAFLSVELLPIKRFSVPIMIYFDPRDAERIISLLANFLPHDQRNMSWIDQLMQHVRF